MPHPPDWKTTDWKNHFTRWYDQTPELSQAVRMLEHQRPEFQRLICAEIGDKLSVYKLSLLLGSGLRQLGAEKIMGLMKSKVKQRWYDQDPVVHNAFNFLFLMDTDMRREIAIKIIVSLHALNTSKRRLPTQPANILLIRNIFRRTQHELFQKISVFSQLPSSKIGLDSTATFINQWQQSPGTVQTAADWIQRRSDRPVETAPPNNPNRQNSEGATLELPPKTILSDESAAALIVDGAGIPGNRNTASPMGLEEDTFSGVGWFNTEPLPLLPENYPSENNRMLRGLQHNRNGMKMVDRKSHRK